MILTFWGRPVVAECKTGLRANAVVPRRVDGAVGDADVFATVDVDAIAIGVDLEVVDGEVVYAGEEQSEVAALEDGEVAEDEVAAVLERDGLVAYSRLLRLVHGVVAAWAWAGLIGWRSWPRGPGAFRAKAAAGGSGCGGRTSRAGAEAEAFAPDEARASDGEVRDVFAPEEGVVPVVVAVVLIGVVAGIGLGGVVGSAHVAGGFRRVWVSRRQEGCSLGRGRDGPCF